MILFQLPIHHSLNSVDEPVTFGALDLGGASTQITFIPAQPLPPEKIAKYGAHLDLYGGPYDVYSQSYLCYGNNEARRQFLANLIVVNEL